MHYHVSIFPLISRLKMQSIENTNIINSMINGKNSYKVVIGPFKNLSELTKVLNNDTIQKYEDLEKKYHYLQLNMLNTKNDYDDKCEYIENKYLVVISHVFVHQR